MSLLSGVPDRGAAEGYGQGLEAQLGQDGGQQQECHGQNRGDDTGGPG